MIANLSARRQRFFDEEGRFILDELHHTGQEHVREHKTLKVGMNGLVDGRSSSDLRIRSSTT